LVERIVAEKEAHPLWGPRKIRARLMARQSEKAWPAASTIGEILKRHGLVEGRRRARWRASGTHPLTAGTTANQVWTADHKGWFRTGDGRRCEPLTVLDGYSRYCLALTAVGSTRGEEAWPVFERAFEEYGLPQVLRSDNGPPFASSGITGLTELSTRFIELGIKLERIEPGRPTQNGAHERFHRTMLPLLQPAAADAAAQQASFDAFRREYNEERPHEALGQTPPAQHYRASGRPLPRHVPEPDYPDTAAKRRVRHNGEIKWRGGFVFISEALVGKVVAVEDNEEGEWLVRFHTHQLGHIDEKHEKLRRHSVASPRGGDAVACNNHKPEL
jgi:transposase InsO family protein